MALYKFNCNYPDEKKTGWSGNVQGLTHDDRNWIITQTNALWKIPLTHDLSKKASTSISGVMKVGIPAELRSKRYNHFGDLDCYRNYLFIPMEGGAHPAIAVFDANTLSYVCHQVLYKKEGIYFDYMAWCAVNPKDGRLYVSDKQIDDDYAKGHSPVMVFDIDFKKIKKNSTGFLRRFGAIVFRNEDGSAFIKNSMQGGCFDDKNRLHLNSGFYDKGYTNDGIQVFKILEVLKMRNGLKFAEVSSANASKHLMFVSTFEAASTKKKERNNKFWYEFHPGFSKYEEPEGLTFWNLNQNRLAPRGAKGVLHVLMLDNEARSDDVYIKHYDLV